MNIFFKSVVIDLDGLFPSPGAQTLRNLSSIRSISVASLLMEFLTGERIGKTLLIIRIFYLLLNATIQEHESTCLTLSSISCEQRACPKAKEGDE